MTFNTTEVIDYRLDIDPEFQGWILAFTCLTAIFIFCFPCYCAGLSCSCARRFANHSQKRLPLFYVITSIFNMGMIWLVVQWLPDWSFKDFAVQAMGFVVFMAENLVDLSTSIVMIIAFIFVVVFKDRILKLIGLDHRTVFRCKIRDAFFCFMPRTRPIEVTIWKVEDLPSADMFSANNVFVQVFLGYNEEMKTRVRNNAGSSCVLKETMELNFDEDDDEESLFLFVNNQKIVGKSELGRLELKGNHVKEIERETQQRGVPGGAIEWSEKCFVKKGLIPRGSIWLRIQPVQDDDSNFRNC